MAGSTDHYGLSKLESGDAFAANGYKYTNADRQSIDNLLYLGAEGHVHDGASGTVLTPDDPLQLTLNNTGGTLPASTRIYYKWTYVNFRGEESIASPEAYIDTAAAVSEPSAPVLSYATTGGVLGGGNYFYVLSAYVGTSINETKALSPGYITVPITSSTNVLTLTFPSAPAGATGFNIYRRSPGQGTYYYLDSVDVNVATPPTSYVDDGSVAQDCDRTIASVNSTNSANSVDIQLPVSVPSLPAGYTWKIYRTYVSTNWATSVLHHVVEYTNEATPIVTTIYSDVGNSTTTGTFPSQNLLVSSPSKILLTGAAEVQGYLPMANVVGFPQVVTFYFSGIQTAGDKSIEWPCPFQTATIMGAMTALDRGSSPASTSLITDVVVLRGATPTWTSVYAVQGDMPTITVGNNKTGALASATGASKTLSIGEVMSVKVIQAGGGATPTDNGLTVTVLLYVTF